MRQALSISFRDGSAADRAELRATMSMSGVFDFTHFETANVVDEEETESENGGESTQESGENSGRTFHAKDYGKGRPNCLTSQAME